MRCPKCAAKAEAGAEHCTQCGAKLEPESGPGSRVDSGVGDVGMVKGDVDASTSVSHDDHSQTSVRKTEIRSQEVVEGAQLKAETINVQKEELVNCVICGTSVTRTESRRCPSCSQFVCPVHFDGLENKCARCIKARLGGRAALVTVATVAAILVVAAGVAVWRMNSQPRPSSLAEPVPSSMSTSSVPSTVAPRPGPTPRPRVVELKGTLEVKSHWSGMVSVDDGKEYQIGVDKALRWELPVGEYSVRFLSRGSALWEEPVVIREAETAALSVDVALFPVVKDGKSGFIDRTGRLAIEPKFRAVRHFQDGLAAVTPDGSENGLCGFIDKTGQMVIEPRFWALGFSEGLAAAAPGDSRDGKWGYIDKTGEMVFKPVLDEAQEFHDGMALVKFRGQWHYIDRSGVFRFTCAEGSPLTEGLARVKVGGSRAGKWGYIDREGKVAIQPVYQMVTIFSEGLAAVRAGEEKTGRRFFIDKTGRIVAEVRVDALAPPSEGLALVLKGEKWGFVDRTGKMVIQPRFDTADSFSEGLARVLVGGDGAGKWGFIDKTGKMVIQPQFDLAASFSEGLARVNMGGEIDEDSSVEGGKWGYIDKTGKYVWEPTN